MRLLRLQTYINTIVSLFQSFQYYYVTYCISSGSLISLVVTVCYQLGGAG